MIKTVSKVLIVGVFGSLLSCDLGKKEVEICEGYSPDVGSLVDDEDYELINLVLEMYAFNNGPQHIIQAVDTLIQSNLLFEFKSEGLEYDSLAIVDLFQKNDSAYLLSPEKLIYSDYVLANQEINCLAEENEMIWDNYYEKYPDLYGFLLFSRPGYNEDRTKAILQYKWFGGASFAEGFAVQFEKVDGHWQPTLQYMLWLS